MPLVHHELCFGCGRANLFGLLAELEPAGDGRVAGRCFIKQDHQGARPGSAHDGVLAAALIEAMSLAHGGHARMRALEVRFETPTPVGSFVELSASGDTASASVDGSVVASASASWG
jgi:acyl-coenzyme A thioesterase PaaI-like protein